MLGFVKKLSIVLTRVSNISLWLSGAGLVLMTAFICWQVFGRFVLNDTPTWTETSSILLMGWFILLGSAVGIREGNHLSFDVMLHILGSRSKNLLHTLSDLVVIAFATGMVIYGWQLASLTWNTTIPNLGWSGGLVYFALIWGGTLMVLFSVERILRRYVGLSTARFGEDTESEV